MQPLRAPPATQPESDESKGRRPPRFGYVSAPSFMSPGLKPFRFFFPSRGDTQYVFFILPPTADALRSRLTSRAADAADVIAKRMAKAGSELSHYPEYDYIVINRDLDKSIAEVRAILTAERLRPVDGEQALHRAADRRADGAGGVAHRLGPGRPDPAST